MRAEHAPYKLLVMTMLGWMCGCGLDGVEHTLPAVSGLFVRICQSSCIRALVAVLAADRTRCSCRQFERDARDGRDQNVLGVHD